jgi:ketosteroid isomerase-like protein
MSKLVKVVGIVVVSIFVVTGSQVANAFQDNKKSEAQIRKALADWVAATNRRDDAAADKIWGPNVVGWFPGATEFSRSVAFAVAGLPEKKGEAYSTYELKIDEVAVSGSIAAVYDVWTETKHFNGSSVTVKRIIRGSELWRLQPDGKWRIVRWVSAPEKWERTN